MTLDAQRIERLKEMVHLRTIEGRTLQQIGERFSISRERVRQILRRAQVPSRGAGSSLEEIAKRLDCSAIQLRRVLAETGLLAALKRGWRDGSQESVINEIARHLPKCRICGSRVRGRRWVFCSDDCRTESMRYQYWSEERKHRHKESCRRWADRNPVRAREITARAAKRYTRKRDRLQRLVRLAEHGAPLTLFSEVSSIRPSRVEAE